MNSFLDGVPDLFELGAAEAYGARVLDAVAVKAAIFRSAAADTFSVRACDFVATREVGLVGESSFRKLVVAAWVADWAAYGTVDDRVDLVRLLYVMDAFPAGFRVWFLREGAEVHPVGYTGWYPISANNVELFRRHPADVQHRGQAVPLKHADGGASVYVFNYSIIEPLRGTVAARRLMRTLAEELDAVRPSQLVAITVSDDGTRCAKRFGMEPVQEIRVGSSVEFVCLRPHDS